MKLIENFKKSIYSPEFYKDLQSKPLSFSIKYFYSLVLVLAVVFTFFISLVAIPLVSDFIKNVGPEFLAVYPEGLTLEIKKGEVSVNQPEPIILPLPENAKSSIDSTADFKPVNLLVIDTQDQAIGQILEKHQSLAFLSKNQIIFGQPKDFRVISLDDRMTFTVTKQKLSSFIKDLQDLAVWLSPIIVFGIFIFSLFYLSLNLIYFFLGAILVWALAKIKKINLTYRQSYQVALHAFSLSLILESLSFFLLPGIQFLPTLVMVVIVWINLKNPAIPDAQIPAKVS